MSPFAFLKCILNGLFKTNLLQIVANLQIHKMFLFYRGGNLLKKKLNYFSTGLKIPDVHRKLFYQKFVGNLLNRLSLDPSHYLKTVKKSSLLHPHQFYSSYSDNKTSIIDAPYERLVEHGAYYQSHLMKRTLKGIAFSAHCKVGASRTKGIGGAVAGRGKGKTTTLEHIRSRLNKVPGTLAICITFNNKTRAKLDLSEYCSLLTSLEWDDRMRIAFVCGVMCRLVSSFYNVSLSTVHEELKCVLKSNLPQVQQYLVGIACVSRAELISVLIEALAQQLTETDPAKPIDTVVVLLDEPVAAVDTLRGIAATALKLNDPYDLTMPLLVSDFQHAVLDRLGAEPPHQVLGTIVISSLHPDEINQTPFNRPVFEVFLANQIPGWYVLKHWWLRGDWWALATQHLSHSDFTRLYLLVHLLSDVPRLAQVFDDRFMVNIREELSSMGLKQQQQQPLSAGRTSEKKSKVADGVSQQLLPNDWLGELSCALDTMDYMSSRVPGRQLAKIIVFGESSPITTEVLELIGTSCLSNVLVQFKSSSDRQRAQLRPTLSLFLGYQYVRENLAERRSVCDTMEYFAEMVRGALDLLDGKTNKVLGKKLEGNGDFLEYFTYCMLKMRLQAVKDTDKRLSARQLFSITENADDLLPAFLRNGVIDVSNVSFVEGLFTSGEVSVSASDFYAKLDTLTVTSACPTMLVRCMGLSFDHMLVTLVKEMDGKGTEVSGVRVIVVDNKQSKLKSYAQARCVFDEMVQCQGVTPVSNVAAAFFAGNVDYLYITTVCSDGTEQGGVRSLSNRCESTALSAIVLTEAVTRSFFGDQIYGFIEAAQQLGFAVDREDTSVLHLVGKVEELSARHCVEELSEDDYQSLAR